MARHLLLVLLSSPLLSPPDACAADPIAVTGSLDAYVSLNPEGDNSLRAFDTYANELSFSYAELVLERAASPVGFRLDLGFGPTADIVNATDGEVMRHVQQAFATWRASDRVSFRFGKTVTPFGFEVIETQANWCYSQGLLFSWAIPFTQTGVAMTVTPVGQLDVTVAVVNGKDNTLDANEFKSPIVQLVGRPHGRVALTATYGLFNERAGEEGEILDLGAAVHLVDVIATFALSGALDLALEGVLGVEPGTSHGGAALFARWRPTARLQAALRGEWFHDGTGMTFGLPDDAGDIFSATGTMGYAPAAGLLLRAEARVDAGDLPRQTTFTLGAVASF